MRCVYETVLHQCARPTDICHVEENYEMQSKWSANYTTILLLSLPSVALRFTLSNHVAHFQFSPTKVLKRAIDSNRMCHNCILSRIGHSIILRSRCIKITKNDESESRSSICDTVDIHGVCRYGVHQFCNCSWISSKG